MWQVKWIPPGYNYEVRHSNGKQATEVIFKTAAEAQKIADYYNKTKLSFCPDCGTSQINGWCCGVCAQARLEKEGSKLLEGRIAKCYCKKEYSSVEAYENKTPAFFEYLPDRPNDIVYDGCRGWD